jgi:hypothetical protein
MIATRGCKQQNLCFSGPTIWIALQNQRANFLGTGAAAWLAGQHNVLAKRAQMIR